MLKQKTNIRQILLLLAGLIVLNIISSRLFKRFDLTEDQRYTLSDATVSIVKDIDAPMVIDVFLQGNFPSEFRLLQTETKQLIEELTLLNPLIKVNYIDPIENESTRDRNIRELTQSGLEPYINSTRTNGKVTQELIFPWAYASYHNKKTPIPLLKKDLTSDLKQQITNSIQHLEYAFADGFSKIVKPKSKKIAILKGNGQLGDIYIADFLRTIKPYYKIAPFTLDSVATNPNHTLDRLKTYDLIISAKPNEPFTEDEKLVLDQYTMYGGKSIWLTEAIIMDKDSLYNDQGNSVSIMKDLNLNDFFFKYGVRINPSLVKSLYSAPITLAIGEGNNAQFQPVQWQYSPLAASNPEHPISNNLNLVKFDFASPIDTLKNKTKKTILLQSADRSKLEGPLTAIALSDITKAPDESLYNAGKQDLAVLLEGNIVSVYDKRILPFKVKDYKSTTNDAKIVVISDGDVIKNEVARNQPVELGFDRFTGRKFGNKEFLLNTVNYLLDDSGLINIRTKEINISFLDSEKTEKERTRWQLINIVLPLILLAIFGYLFNYFRKRKYT